MTAFRATLTISLLFLTALPGASPASAAARSSAAERQQPEGEPRAAPPSVLFIVVDDLNDWIGCLGGHPQSLTPNIDRLAARGTLFTNAHAPAPACNPSRAAVMTGIAPHRSGLYDQSPNFRDVFPDAVTLQQRLQSFGYETLGAGKVFHKPYPDPASWNAFYPAKDVQIPPDSARRKLFPVLGPHFAAKAEGLPANLSDGKVATWVCSNLSRPPEKPFFLACGLHRPHIPWVAPASSFEKFPLDGIVLPAIQENDLDDVPAAALEMSGTEEATEEQRRLAVQSYLACISFVDDQVGRVIDALDASPSAANTLVVLWSDNGYHMGEKRSWSKFTLWEESTRVPLIVVAPGKQAGARCNRPVSLQDLYPTLIELCGLPPVAGIDGQSLVPLIEDPGAPWERPALTTCGYENHALRSERWRYIRYADGSEELYDHAADPNEWKNLAADPRHAAVKAELARWLPAEDAPSLKEERPSRGR